MELGLSLAIRVATSLRCVRIYCDCTTIWCESLTTKLGPRRLHSRVRRQYLLILVILYNYGTCTCVRRHPFLFSAISKMDVRRRAAVALALELEHQHQLVMTRGIIRRRRRRAASCCFQKTFCVSFFVAILTYLPHPPALAFSCQFWLLTSTCCSYKTLTNEWLKNPEKLCLYTTPMLRKSYLYRN